MHGSAVERAPRELKAFARVHLGARRDAGGCASAVPVAELAWFDAGRGWVIEATDYEALVAHHAHDGTPLSARFRISGT